MMHLAESTTPQGDEAMPCLHVVLFQDMPGMWIGRGLEHDIVAEARTIGETVRALLRLVQAHIEFDCRHNRAPLSAFRSAPQICWNAFATGMPLPLTQLGITQLDGWHIVVALSRSPHRAVVTVPPALRAAV